MASRFGKILRGVGADNPQSIAAWGVAGALAYFLWVRPGQQEKEREQLREQLQRQQEQSRGKPVQDT
uniref:Uncharacterized protein n=1 Tax=Tetraselmis sp. GSL018 TaxID=582737 RepID=A0A061SEV4_9CHLO